MFSFQNLISCGKKNLCFKSYRMDSLFLISWSHYTWQSSSLKVLCCLMMPSFSKVIRCYVWPYAMFVNDQMWHQAKRKMGCQPSDCRSSLQSSSGVCMGMYGQTHLIYQSRVHSKIYIIHHVAIPEAGAARGLAIFCTAPAVPESSLICCMVLKSMV